MTESCLCFGHTPECKGQCTNYYLLPLIVPLLPRSTIVAPLGNLKWRFNVGSHADCGVVVGEPGGDFSHVLVIQSNEGGMCDALGKCYVFGIDKRNGRELWRSLTGKAGIGGGGTIAADSYFSGSWDRSVTSLKLGTGDVNWKVNVGGEVESRPAFHDGVVFFSAEESHTLVAINAQTGSMKWEYTGATQEFNGSPSLSSGLVYAGANDKYLHVVNITTGALVFKFETCANVFAAAAIADDGEGSFSFQARFGFPLYTPAWSQCKSAKGSFIALQPNRLAIYICSGPCSLPTLKPSLVSTSDGLSFCFLLFIFR